MKIKEYLITKIERLKIELDGYRKYAKEAEEEIKILEELKKKREDEN
ncbi:hypothetical protein LCGC14_1898160 [marine sediment metagenome]|uniref:Uncharacterized protein n=1 Tax=marine sediment metagenome TaxID=412755 RepID=A0A0F9GKR9_9ZZZZ